MDRGKRALVLLAVPQEDYGSALTGLLSGAGLDILQTATGEQALTMVDRALPSLVVVALDVSGPTGYEVLFRLRTQHGRWLAIGVLAPAFGATARDEVAALLLGADDYFERGLDPDVVVARIRRLTLRTRITGGHDTSFQRFASPGENSDASLDRLTRREQEVLGLLADGRRPGEIAELLCITPKTVSTHIERILGKLGAHSQAQAVAFALRHGAVRPDRGPTLVV